MLETECQSFFEEELKLLDALAENSRKQMRKLDKRLWSGLRRLSAERDEYLKIWQERNMMRKEAWKSAGYSLQAVKEQVKTKQVEVEQLHAELMQETECTKRALALKMQQLRKGQDVVNQYQGPVSAYARWSIQG